MTLNDKLAALFRSKPHQWLRAQELMSVAGQMGWRTRCSNLRKPPYAMDIQNRLRTVRSGDPLLGGAKVWQVSEYRYVPSVVVEPSAQVGHDLNTWELKP